MDPFKCGAPVFDDFAYVRHHSHCKLTRFQFQDLYI